MKNEHVNKLNLTGAIAVGASFVLTVMLSALDFPQQTVSSASVIVSTVSLLWAACGIFNLMAHDSEPQEVFTKSE